MAGTHSFWSAILLGGLIAGTIDIGAAAHFIENLLAMLLFGLIISFFARDHA